MTFILTSLKQAQMKIGLTKKTFLKERCACEDLEKEEKLTNERYNDDNSSESTSSKNKF